MSVAFTSRMSYQATQASLSGLQREVWLAIRDWSPATIAPSLQELAEKLNRKEGSICGRINELRAAGAIEDGPLKMGDCGKMVKTYRAVVWIAPTNETAQMTLF